MNRIDIFTIGLGVIVAFVYFIVYLFSRIPYATEEYDRADRESRGERVEPPPVKRGYGNHYWNGSEFVPYTDTGHASAACDSSGGHSSGCDGAGSDGGSCGSH